MRSGAKLAALENDEQHSSNNRDEVQRQVHEVADNGCWGELGEGLGDKLAQLRNGVASRLDLALVLDQGV